MLKRLCSYPWAPQWGVPQAGRGTDRFKVGRLDEPQDADEEDETGENQDARGIPWVLQGLRERGTRGRSPSVPRPAGRAEGAAGQGAAGAAEQGAGASEIAVHGTKRAAESATELDDKRVREESSAIPMDTKIARGRDDGDGLDAGSDSKRLRVVGGLTTLDEEDFAVGDLALDQESLEESESLDSLEPDRINADEPEDPHERERLVTAGYALELARLEQFEAFTPRDRRKLLPSDKVIGSRWVTGWKRTETGELVYRARWVLKDFADHKSLAFFAPTTSTKQSRILSALAVERNMVHFAFDASNAFLHASISEEQRLQRIFVQPPQQWIEENGELLNEIGIPARYCIWQARKAINGLRIAPQMWLDHATSILTKRLSCSQCLTSACFFSRRLGTLKELMLEIHMDDIHGICHLPSVYEEFRTELAQELMVKPQGPFGSGEEFFHLKRRHKLGNGWVEIHPNQKHASDVLKLLDMEGCKPVGSPRVEYSERQAGALQGALSAEDHAKYRTAVGKLLYLALDRIDLCYAVGQLSRALSKPTELDMLHLRRCARYLSGTANARIRLTAGGTNTELADLCVFSDADHASIAKQ
eukprot:6489812-Amphidinium_carterae.1